MGSKEASIVPYDRYRSRSRSRSRSPSRSRYRSRSRSRSGKDDKLVPRVSVATEKVEQKRLAKEQAAFRVESTKKAVEAAQKAWEAAQKSMEAAIAADLEAAKELEEAKSEAGRADQEQRIQKIVDQRQEMRVKKDFSGADRLLQELRDLGVQVNDKDISWTGPGGLQGKPQRQAPPPRKGSGRGGSRDRGYDDRGGSRDRGRKSPKYDRYDDRDRGGPKKKKYASSSSGSPSPPRRGRGR